MLKAVGKAMVAMEMGGRQLVPTVDVQLVPAGEHDRIGKATKTSVTDIYAFEWAKCMVRSLISMIKSDRKGSGLP